MCALRAGLADPDGPERQESMRRQAVMCAEVCDATHRVLAERPRLDEAGIRARVEWCRTICLECA